MFVVGAVQFTAVAEKASPVTIVIISTIDITSEAIKMLEKDLDSSPLPFLVNTVPPLFADLQSEGSGLRLCA